MSLECEKERTAVTFRALWRPVLALEAWAGRVDTRLADMSRDRYDDHRLIHDMLVQQAAMKRELQEMRGRVTALYPSWNRLTFYNDDDEYTVIYRKPKAITPDLPIEEPDNSLNLLTLCLDEIVRSHLLRLIFFPRSSSVKSILLILDGNDCDKDDFDEEKEGDIDIDIFQIEDEILREKLLNVNLLIDKIKALKLTPSIPFVLENPSSSPIPVVDSEFLIEEVDTFLVPEDSIPPGIESDLDSEGDAVFLDDLLYEDPIPEYERFTFDIELDAPVINNFDELNEDECFDPGGGEINVSQNVEVDDSFTFVIRTFLPYLTYPVDSPLLLSTRSEDTIFDPGIST
ncbi:hypothetical protein Tco_1105144 [Tanacetum coccineum]